jgi:signal transduction histidine kinase
MTARGFNAPSPQAHGEGFGLLGIGERAALVGGKVLVDSRPGAGTRVTVTVPRPQPGLPAERPVPLRAGA